MLAPSASPPRKVARTEHSHHTASSSSVNPIFALTAPRAGVLSFAQGIKSLETLLDTVDDDVYVLLEDAWKAVGVPAHGYWSQSPLYNIGPTAAAFTAGVVTAPPLEVRIPDPLRLGNASFYAVRTDAIVGRGYEANRRQLVVAIDRTHGHGSKLFNVLPRLGPTAAAAAAGAHTAEKGGQAVASFIEAIPHRHQRNMYVLVDENAAVDPYFDVDFSHTSASGDASCMWWRPSNTGADAPLELPEVESLLLEVLKSLTHYFESTLETTVAECLVLTSSAQIRGGEVKLSFHIHFRLQRKEVFASVKALHAFMCRFREHLEGLVAAKGDAATGAEEMTAEQRAARVVLQFVDFGVYTRWRAFRLPYCVKSPLADASGPFTLVDAAADDLLVSQLEHTGVSLPRVDVGCAADSVMQSVTLSSDPSVRSAQEPLMTKLFFCFRFLLPIVPGSTKLSNTALKSFLEARAPRVAVAESGEENPAALRHAFASAIIDLACIQRDHMLTSNDSLQILQTAAAAAEAPLDGAARSANPFELPMPPMPQGARVPVHDAHVKKLIAEIFACLSPHYHGTHTILQERGGTNTNVGLDAARLNVQYSEGVRAYYVFQKQTKYCLRLGREHKGTYAQLYLTYGSIKVRCYSNDCCQRCVVVPWALVAEPNSNKSTAGGPGTNTLPHAAGYPKHDRLREIRDFLFPELPLEELVRRYGPQVVGRGPS